MSGSLCLNDITKPIVDVKEKNTNTFRLKFVYIIFAIRIFVLFELAIL